MQRVLDVFELGLGHDRRASVNFIVGANGSGKSSLLREFAVYLREQRESVIVISNTPYDRFRGLRGLVRISAANGYSSASSIVKRAVRVALESDGSGFSNIASTLDYCNYNTAFGLSINKNEISFYQDTYAKIRSMNISIEEQDEIFLAIDLLAKNVSDDIIWVDYYQNSYSFSYARQYAAILKWESILRKLDVISGIEILLRRRDGRVIDMRNASSGELSLISSLVFLATSVGENAIILIDEPENSLHPQWQKDYVKSILDVLQYKNPFLLIATHAPLVVSGSLSTDSDIVKVFQLFDKFPSEINIKGSGSGHSKSVEEILWKAFDTVTPASNYVSEELVAAISDLEAKRRSYADVILLINEMKSASFDAVQIEFLQAVQRLAVQVADAALEK